MEGYLGRYAEMIGALPPQKKLMLLVLLAAVIGGVVLMTSWAKTPEYGVLFSNMDQEDVQLVIGKLKEKKVDCKAAGSAVMVPEDKVYDLRMELAGEGVPRGGGIGFEIFDKNSLGMTEFVQKMNYQRALQGELARTIRQLAEVEDCRVHLVLPERSLFINSQDKARASVVLKLKGGRLFTPEQSQGIVHLVSSSVEGLSPQDVTLLDTKGRMLSSPGEGDPSVMLSSTQLAYRKSVEKDMEQRVQSMLEAALGQGKAVVRVTADMDFTQEEKSEETYDPKTTVLRSQQKTSEKEATGQFASSGIPGVSSNVPKKAAAKTSSQPGATSEKQSETANYEVSLSKSHIIKPTGTIKKISVAVLVDGAYETKGDKRVFVPKSPAELAKLDSIVKGAMGFTAERGDVLEMVNVPFESAAEAESLAGTSGKDPWYVTYGLRYVKQAVVALGMLLIFLFVVRPMLKSLGSSIESQAAALGGPVKVEEFENSMSAQPRMLAGGGAHQIEGVREVIQQKPAQAAHIVKGWLKER